MKKIFSEREINEYINSGFSDNDRTLRTNPYFMAAVIEKTGNYRVYELYCDDSIKTDPIIMKVMLEVFGREYLSKDGDRFNKGLSKLSKVTDNIDNYFSNNSSVATKFLEMITLLAITNGRKTLLLDDYFKKELEPYTDEYGVLCEDCQGLFGRMAGKYNSEVVQELFAVRLTKKIINDLFYTDVDSLSYRSIEDIVHNKVVDKELLDDEMVICSIISCIAEADTSLANYLSEHKELLSKYGSYAKTYYKYWDNYEADKIFNKVDSFVGTVKQYLVSHSIDVASEDVVRAIGKKYSIDGIINDYYDRLAEDRLLNDVPADKEEDADKARIKELEKYRYLERIRRIDNMVNNDSTFKPLLSLARRTFNIKEDDNNKVLSLSSPITGGSNK